MPLSMQSSTAHGRERGCSRRDRHSVYFTSDAVSRTQASSTTGVGMDREWLASFCSREQHRVDGMLLVGAGQLPPGM